MCSKVMNKQFYSTVRKTKSRESHNRKSLAISASTTTIISFHSRLLSYLCETPIYERKDEFFILYPMYSKKKCNFFPIIICIDETMIAIIMNKIERNVFLKSKFLPV